MNIYESIAAVQTDIDFIGKDKQVQSGGTYKYRGVDQVLNTLHPLFAKHKVFAVPEVLEIMEREIRKTQKGGEVLYQVLKIKYTFYAEDGSNIAAIVVGEAMDSGDKVSNKCMSVAYKYACFQILSIPTEENCPDPDDDNDSFAADKPDKQKPAKKQTKLDVVKDILRGSEFDMDCVTDYIKNKWGEEIPVNELTEDQFTHLVTMLRRNVNKIN